MGSWEGLSSRSVAPGASGCNNKNFNASATADAIIAVDSYVAKNPGLSEARPPQEQLACPFPFDAGWSVARGVGCAESWVVLYLLSRHTPVFLVCSIPALG